MCALARPGGAVAARAAAHISSSKNTKKDCWAQNRIYDVAQADKMTVRPRDVDRQADHLVSIMSRLLDCTAAYLAAEVLPADVAPAKEFGH